MVDPRAQGHVFASALTAFLLDVVSNKLNFLLVVLELSTTKSGYNISSTFRFFVFRRVCDDYYQTQRLALAGRTDFAVSCFPIAAKPPAGNLVDFLLAYLQTEFLGEF